MEKELRDSLQKGEDIMRSLWLCSSRVATLVLVVLSSVFARAQGNVLTWHNDIGRTGQNPNEIKLTSSISKTTFGRICSYPVDGQVYGQPLVLWDSVNKRNVVYVVTMNDTVYAFDGTNSTSPTCTLIAKNNQLLPSGEYPADCCSIGNIACPGPIIPQAGILGMPVIDSGGTTLYLIPCYGIAGGRDPAIGPALLRQDPTDSLVPSPARAGLVERQHLPAGKVSGPGDGSLGTGRTAQVYLTAGHPAARPALPVPADTT